MDTKKIGEAIANVGSFLLGTGIVGSLIIGGDTMKKLTVAGGVTWISGSVIDIAISSLVKE